MSTVLSNVLVMTRDEICRRLTEIQAELDYIGPTFGMQGRRTELNHEKNELLDQLNTMRKPAA